MPSPPCRVRAPSARDRAPLRIPAARSGYAPGVTLPPWLATVRDALRDASEDRIAHTAAGVAFYWFLAVFPLLIALIGIVALLGLEPVAMSRLETWVRSVVPGGAATLVTGAMERAREAAGGGLAGPLVAIAAAVWGGLRGMIATQIGLDIAYDLPSDRPWFRERLVALGLLGAIALVGSATLSLALLGGPLGRFVAMLPGPLALLGGLSPLVAWAIAVLALAVLLTFLYAFGPNRRPPQWRFLSPGVVFATVGWALAGFGFTIYLERFGGSYAETYGPLADVVVLLLWLYVAALVVLFGAELNAQAERAPGGRVSHRGPEGRRRR